MRSRETAGAGAGHGRGAPGDVLDLLLPGADAQLVDRGRRLATFLRLLIADGHPTRQATVRVDADSAARELSTVETSRQVALLEDLLRHHLQGVLGAETFAWFGAPERGVEEAWGELLGEQLASESGAADARVRPLPGPPGPGESPLAVARRLLSAWPGSEGGAPLLAGRAALWEARLARARGGPRAGEEAARALLAPGSGLRFDERLEAAADAAAALLDRGAVRAARDLLDEHLALVSCSEHLARLFGWTHLLLGQVDVARETLGALPPFEGPLPAPLVSLRARRPEWLRWLSGRDPRAAEPAAPLEARDQDPPAPELDRREVGASAALALALGPGRTALAVASDVAPALKQRLAEWLRERDGACMVPAEPEHRLVVEARAACDETREGETLRGALAPGARAVVRQPVLDAIGEVAGWIHLEFEHHLVPGPERLAALAHGARSAVLSAASGQAAALRCPARGAPEPGVASSSAAALGLASPPSLPVAAAGAQVSACAEAFAELAAALGMKTAQRRIFGLVVEGGEPVLVREEGGALDDWLELPGGRRALTRALRTGGVVAFDAPEPGLSIHRESSSGLVLPIRAAGRVVALLAVESLRRLDFRPADRERLAALAAAHAPAVRVAQFRDWHLQRFGYEVVFDAGGCAIGPRVLDVVAAGASRAPVALTGPPGTGKQVLARWIHFESERRDGEIAVFACGATSAGAAVERLLGAPGGGLLGSASGGTLVLDHVDRLSGEAQAALHACLEQRESPPGARSPREHPARVVATAWAPLCESVRAGQLREDLARSLDRLQIHVPPLAERRDEIPALVRCFLRRFAREEDVRTASLDDEALGLLWRQPWTGNVRELENLLYKVALHHPGETLDAAGISELGRRYRTDLSRRLSSRHPTREDIDAALRVTQKGTGNLNKTRAAMYLGWDPDTLVARMQDLGIGEGGPAVPA